MRLTFNGGPREHDPGPDDTAADVIRTVFGATGTKVACGAGVCGACTILVDGEPKVSCLLPAAHLDGTEVTTVEGVGGDHPVQRAFVECDALQCGFCTPGFVTEAVAFHDRWRKDHEGTPSREEVAAALTGHLCRCGAYENIVAAVRQACAGVFDDREPVPARVEAPAKVAGAAEYTVDVSLPGMLHGVIVRSRLPHARVTVKSPEMSEKTSPASAAGRPVAGFVRLLQGDVVRYTGQPIAAVAAETPALARELAERVTVDYEALPSVVDPAEARRDGAPVIFADAAAQKAAPSSAEGAGFPGRWRGNVRSGYASAWRGRAARRRLDAAEERNAPGYFAATFTTSGQSHTALEPHASVADWRPDGLTLHVSTQALPHVKAAAAKRWNPPKVEVVAQHVGGGFGSKLGLSTDVVAAVELSRRLGRPVRVAMSRAEELTDTGYRPGTRSELRMLGTPTGGLAAISLDVSGHGGVSTGSMVATLGLLMYGRGPRHFRDRDVIGNAPPASPFRGPGGPPFAWAVEQGVDEIAHRLGADPLKLRRTWDGNRRRRALYEIAAELPLWRDRPATPQTGRYRRGVGAAAANWIYTADVDTKIELTVRDGRIVARTATQDIGTGVRTVIRNAVREVFPDADVVVEVGHSDAPHGPVAGGSRSTASVGPAARDAAGKLAAHLGGKPVGAAEGVTVLGERPKDRRGSAVPVSMDHLRVGRGLAGAVHITEVEVDTLLGHTRVTRVWGGIAAGAIYNRTAARNQCEGGIVQGIGYALYEERITDPRTGVVLSANLEDYRLPGVNDTPEMTIHFHEDGWDHVPGGGVGLGEVCTVSVAASVGNAVFNATGFRPLDLPIRPDRLLEGMPR
ncbi:molybdopterin-dependent oxidoreductase [Herbidospora sp. NEAU-GS84]|uniref:Molybdopterin-dependent oxidoreductase n=1 Tax=Herbidospora solisilvae TaxID=2696284 RepID=A0A7C9J7Y8_9ACTN|nr:molybdopterin-dependent oxidoreductase [Herbidospora solisilvae]NAS27102.1 molybdopterin-dependent oxidoreductase [Herbidospora solisilvae]